MESVQGFRRPKEDSRYAWTNHVVGKMLQYRISENLIKRVVRFPTRVEEGVAEETVAVMKPAEGVKKYSEVWVMYSLAKLKNRKQETKYPSTGSGPKGNNQRPKITVITAWRYPGKSPERDPIPEEVIMEVRNILNR